MIDNAKSESFGLKWKTIYSYSGTIKTRSLVGTPETILELKLLIRHSLKENLTICFRGPGNTFGEVVLNNNHMIIDTRKLERILSWNKDSGVMVVGAGATMRDVFTTCFSDNWTLSAIPGSLDVTVVGAISNNVHGKDSVHHGNFGDQVESLKILIANEEIREVSRKNDPDLFNAVIGGMGLLGAVIEVTLNLNKIKSPYIETFMIPVKNIEECVVLLDQAAKENDFAVCWVDPFLKGKKMGRGFIKCANWVESSRNLDRRELDKSLVDSTHIFGILPPKIVWFLFRPLFFSKTVKVLNVVNYWLQWTLYKLGFDRSIQLFTDYNFILRKVPKVKDVYNPYGAVELQPMISANFGATAFRKLFQLGQNCGFESLLCVIKKHRKDNYLFSYSGDSYSIGWTIHLKNRKMAEILDFNKKLLDLQFKFKGKTFLAKDSLLTSEQFSKMYPSYKEFLKIKTQLDPEDTFSSDYYKKTIHPIS